LVNLDPKLQKPLYIKALPKICIGVVQKACYIRARDIDVYG